METYRRKWWDFCKKILYAFNFKDNKTVTHDDSKTDLITGMTLYPWTSYPGRTVLWSTYFTAQHACCEVRRSLNHISTLIFPCFRKGNSVAAAA